MALGGQACGKLLDLLENIFGYPKTRASKDFEASLQPHSLLDMEEEPEAEAIMATGDPGPLGSKGAEGTIEPVKHHSLKVKPQDHSTLHQVKARLSGGHPAL